MSVSPHPASLLNSWLRDHPRANMAHKVLHYHGSELIAYCGRKFPADESSAQGGVLLCSKCWELSGQRNVAKLKTLKNQYKRRVHNASASH